MPDGTLQFAGVELYFEDLPRAKKFYRDFLGLELEEDDLTHHAKFRLGERFLCLEKRGGEDYPSADKAALFFEVEDLAKFLIVAGSAESCRQGRNPARPAGPFSTTRKAITS